ncbi:MAG: VWA domain-containing protein, partial [Chloroflexi bacterium]|nr:VWA domain-containing protein [Chloroflexota bacterium]
MITFATPIALLLAIPLLALVVLARRHTYANLSQRRMRLALGVRLAILAALVLGLAGARLRLPQSHQAVVFVADLSASDYGQRGAVQALINGAAAGRPGGDVMGVVSVGRQPVVEQPVTAMTGFDGFQSSVDPQYTNLQGGLDLANALLPGSYRHRVVLVTDGQQNVGDALASARLLRSQGVRVDVAPLRVPGGPEVLVDRVDVPSQLRPRESFALTVVVRSTVATTTGLTIIRDRTVVGSWQETVRVGSNRYVFDQSPLAPGFHTYRVEITPVEDTQPENNQGSAFTSVASAPRVLVIAGQPSEAANLMASLKSTDIQADLRTPAQVTPELSYLQRYAGVVIVDTAADVLGADLMAPLVPYVRDLGHGLVVLGGQNAYSMGGYGQTPLEQVLPVSMDIPKRRNMPTTAVALILESLEEDTQINISKEAGKSVVNLLTPQDQVAVNDAPFDASPGWVVPLQRVTDRAAIDAAIDRMAPGDPESYTPSLQSAYTILKHTSAKVKHIILLGDGDAEDPSYQQLIQSIRAGGVTVSTVATNGLGRNDFQTMQDIARWGGGRYYRADDPSKIPQIFLRETRTTTRLGIVPGKFFPQELSANPMLRDVRKVAPLYGYIATTPKPAAEIVLASGKLDPVLAAWQFGLGRSVAWTSDAAGLWTKDWLRVPGANRFWANLVSWTLPAAGTGQLFVSASTAQGQGHLSVTTPASLGADPAVTARVL